MISLNGKFSLFISTRSRIMFFFFFLCFQYYTKINPPDRRHFVPSSACSHQLLHLRYISAPSPSGFHAEPSDGQALIRLWGPYLHQSCHKISSESLNFNYDDRNLLDEFKKLKGRLTTACLLHRNLRDLRVLIVSSSRSKVIFPFYNFTVIQCFLK